MAFIAGLKRTVREVTSIQRNSGWGLINKQNEPYDKINRIAAIRPLDKESQNVSN
jgi:hypothetical protein